MCFLCILDYQVTDMNIEIERAVSDCPSININNGVISIWDLNAIRGRAKINFENGYVGAEDAPVIINFIEIVTFLENILSGTGLHRLELFFETVAFGKRENDLIEFSRFHPEQVPLHRSDNFLECVSVFSIKNELVRLYKIKKDIFVNIDQEVTGYLDNGL